MVIPTELQPLIEERKHSIHDQGNTRRKKTYRPQYKITDARQVISTLTPREKLSVVRADAIIEGLKRQREDTKKSDGNNFHYREGNSLEQKPEVIQVYEQLKCMSKDGASHLLQVRLLDSRFHELGANIEVLLTDGNCIYLRIVQHENVLLRVRSELKRDLGVHISELDTALAEYHLMIIKFEPGADIGQVSSKFFSQLPWISKKRK